MSGKLWTMLLMRLKKLVFGFRLASWSGRKQADMELVSSFKRTGYKGGK